MATTVVNVRGGEGLGKDFDVYIGRRAPRSKVPGTVRNSAWGNPCRVGKGKGAEADPLCFATVEEAVERFEVIMRWRLASGGENGRGEVWSAERWREELLALDGKRLGCWCEPDPCHGRVLVKLIDEVKGQ